MHTNPRHERRPGVAGSAPLRHRGSLALVMALALSTLACDEATETLAPSATGTIVGTVKIDGAGASGIIVTMSNGRTASTGNGGAYSVSDVPSGAYTVTISGYPADVAFPATTQAVVIATAGQTATVNFDGSRVRSQPPQTSPAPATYSGNLVRTGGDASHDPFVFNAGSGSPASLRVAIAGSGIAISAAGGFAPSGLPTLTGAVGAGGSFEASGSGPIAGVGGVSVAANGTLIGGQLQMEIVVGGDGRLPGGQPIRYRFTGTP